MSKRALVVEDDVNIAELLRLYLGKDGFDVMIAPDGGKAGNIIPDEDEVVLHEADVTEADPAEATEVSPELSAELTV